MSTDAHAQSPADAQASSETQAKLAAILQLKETFVAPPEHCLAFTAGKDSTRVAQWRAATNDSFPFLSGFPDIQDTQFTSKVDTLLRRQQAAALFTARLSSFISIELVKLEGAQSEQEKTLAVENLQRLVYGLSFFAGSQFYAAEDGRREEIRNRTGIKAREEPLFSGKERELVVASANRRYADLRGQPGGLFADPRRQRNHSANRARRSPSPGYSTKAFSPRRQGARGRFAGGGRHHGRRGRGTPKYGDRYDE